MTQITEQTPIARNAMMIVLPTFFLRDRPP